MAERTDLPSIRAPNFEQRVRETLMTYLGRQGNPLDRGITLRDLLDAKLIRLREGFGLDQLGRLGDRAIPIAPGTAFEDPPDLTPPPTPTGFEVSAAISHVFVEHDLPNYTQGHGHLRTHLYGLTHVAGTPLPTFAAAVALAQFSGPVFALASNPATTWRLWIRWESVDGVLSTAPAGGTHGLEARTGEDVGTLLDALTGSITESQLFATLGARINLIDAQGTGLVDKVAGLTATYGDTVNSATNAAAAAQSAADAVGARTQALLAQAGAQTARDEAVSAQTSAQTSAAGASTSQAAASNAASGAAGSASSASQSATTAANSASAAGGSASAAATSASHAATYATNSENASTASTNAKVAAESARDAASGSATAAASSASTASSKATEASQSASSASTSATNAATSEATALSYRNQASTSATNAAGSASSASTSATNAANSASAAGGSASAAAGSASSASTSASNAGNAATAANTSRVAAESAATNAGNAASAAATSASTASTKADAAGQSASSASTSATNAATSEATALSYRNQASTSATSAATSASAAAQDYSGVNARLNNAGGTGITVEAGMSAQASSIAGLQGQYTVKIDANGYVSGFGLASTAVNGTPSSALIVRADKFSVANPSGPGIAPIVPFAVTTSTQTINGVSVPVGVSMDAAFIKNGTITAAKIGNATIDSAKIADATITAAKIADATITAAKIADATITAAKISDAAITSAKIADAAITSAKIGSAAVQTLSIAGNAVTIPVLASGTSVAWTTFTRTYPQACPVILAMTLMVDTQSIGPLPIRGTFGIAVIVSGVFTWITTAPSYNPNTFTRLSLNGYYDAPANTPVQFFAGINYAGDNYYDIVLTAIGAMR